MSSSFNINNSFFEGSYQHAWKGTIPPGLTEAEVDFILEAGALAPGSKLLDLMCGYGRHALELGRRGVAVTAIDNLPAYIEETREKARAENLPVEARVDDILQAGLEGVYDTAICMGNSFNFFNKEDGIALLKKLSQHIRPGGILIINSWTIAEVAIKYFKDKDWHFAGPYKCVIENNYCFSPSRIESEMTIIGPQGSIETRKAVDYIFTLDELEEMFQQAGLRTKAYYSTPRKRKFSLGDVRIYIVAEKV
jgi:cyclopropane fatty-acyl-phospholipid synthase-like methyltransferase